MHCNGKCQMMKKLREQEKKDQENNERKTENKIEVTLSSKSFFASVSSQQTDPAPSQVFFNRSNEHTIDRSFDIFHPPQA